MISQDAGLWGLLASAFISSTLAPGGSEAVLAYMVAEGQHAMINLITIASIGNTLGALTTWYLGHFSAKKYPMEKLLSKPKQQAVNSVKRWGNIALLFSWLPLVGDGLCFAAGWLKLPLYSGIIAIALGKTIRYTLVASIFL